MTASQDDSNLRIPKALRHEAGEILKLTDSFCAEHLDAEYGDLCRKLVAKLARKRPSPLERGDLRIWAGAVIYTLGGINFLFDRSQCPHLTGDQLSALTGIPKSTLTAKAKRIREALRIGPMEPELCRQKILASHPLAWLVSVNGVIVDARALPPEIQAEAFRKGLIPKLPDPDAR